MNQENFVDNEAEEVTLGQILLTGDKTADAVLGTGLRPYHFYRPAHEQVFSAIVSMSEKGTPIDLIAVRMEIERMTQSSRAEIQTTLELLTASAGVAESAAVYAGRVLEMATRRDTWRSLRGALDALEKNNQSELSRALEGLATVGGENRRDSLSPSEWGEAIMDYLEKPKQQGFIPLPFPRLTAAMGGGILPGEMLAIAGYTNHGKMLCLKTELPTPSGWKTMGDLEVGDKVFDERGNPTKVVALSETVTEECYEMTFSDGTTVIAHRDHEWVTCTHESRAAASRASRRVRVAPYNDQRHKMTKDSVVTTKQIAETLKTSWGRHRHGVWASGPLRYARKKLPMDPYTLGAWLGDGSTGGGGITGVDPQIFEEIERGGYRVNHYADPKAHYILGAVGHLRQAGVLHDKHIPERYLRSSVRQRLALLQGLMDTDGTICTGKAGARCEIALTNRRLAEGVLELCLGLGLLARWRVDRAKLDGVDYGEVYSIAFTTDMPVFRLKRKLERLPAEVKTKHRTIVSVEPVESVPTRCIQVEAESHQYLVTRSCIPTHNSIVADQLMDMAAKHGFKAHLYMTEMTAAQRGLRLISRRTGVPFGRLRSRELDASHWKLILPELERVPYGVSIVSDWDIEDVVRDALRARFDLIVIDLIHGFSYDDERGLDRLSKAAQRIARVSTTRHGYDGTAVVIVAHLSGAQLTGSRTNKRPKPGLHSLKGSTSLQQDPDFVLFVWQEDDDEGLPTGSGKVWLPKARSGDNESVSITLNQRYLRFDVDGEGEF